MATGVGSSGGRLTGKVALISGGARGQGAAEARLFVAEGARVVIGDVRDGEGEAVASALGDACRYVPLDVATPAGWSRAVESAIEAFDRLDVLVNNAGVFRPTPIATTAADDYMAIVRVNQLGVFLGMQAVLPAMRRVGGGSIVNIASVGGLRGTPGFIAYSASKFAVRGMTKTAALELAHAKVRVNTIHPGVIDTSMVRDALVESGARYDVEGGGVGAQIPIGTISQPEDIARMALFLASDESRHCTGADFVVDGGLTAGVGYAAGP